MSRKSAEAKFVDPETLFEKFIRILMANTIARALLKEIVRVHALPGDTPEAAAVREVELTRLCRLAQEELDAPPRFVKTPRRRWSLWPKFHWAQAK